MATKEQIDKAWNNAKLIKGKNTDKYRQDLYRNPMYKDSYGKNSEIDWEVDYIKPQSKGSDTTHNLQTLNTNTNRNKGDSLIKK